MHKIDRQEVVKRLQDRLDKNSKEDNTAYNNGVADSLKYALYLLKMLEETEKEKGSKQ